MAFLVSPGVEVKEIDMTNSIPALSTSIGAYAGQFRWGPIDTLVTVGSETELGKIFSAPLSIDSEDEAFAGSFLTAASFLKYGSTLRVARAYDPLSSNAYSGTAGYGATGAIGSSDQLENNTFLNKGFYAKYPGALGNSLKVIVYNSDKEVELTDSEDGIFSYLPGTTDYAKSFPGNINANDEVSVAVVDTQGYFSGLAGSVLEIFEGLSVAANAKSDNGSSNYINDVINNRSQYIMAKEVEALFIFGYTAKVYIEPTMAAISYTPTEGVYQLAHGDDGAVDKSDVVLALNLFEDSETVDINFLFAQNFNDDNATVDLALITIAEQRRDILAFLSAPLSIATSGESSAEKTADVVLKFNTYVSSYAVFDSSPVQVYNKYADRYIWIPACGHVAGLCANADLLADPWFSPAGYTRGQLRGVVKLALNPTKSQRDDLYKGKVNPIVSFPGQGIILYGDKTGVSKPSAFGHINVRRLFTTLEKAIATFSKFQLFELNDEFTRAAFRSAVEPYLRNVQARRGITDFRVVCDSTNNTGDIIDSNRFIADIYIKPTYSINYITLNFIATRTGVEFKEIVGG